jgi:hypothetical protein
MNHSSPRRIFTIVGCFGLMVAKVCGQVVVPGAQSDVTLALTLSVTSDLPRKTVGVNSQYSSGILRTSFNNLLFINQLKAANKLPDNTVTGWKLVYVNRTPLAGDRDTVVRAFYLVKTGQPKVLLTDDIIRAISKPGYVEAFTSLVDPSQRTLSGTTSLRGTFTLEGKIPGLTNDFKAQGLLTATDKTGSALINKVSYPFKYQLTSARLTGVVGSATADLNPSPDRNDYLVEGLVIFSAEVPLDISTYPAP